jgi:hypothetical protein
VRPLFTTEAVVILAEYRRRQKVGTAGYPERS